MRIKIHLLLAAAVLLTAMPVKAEDQVLLRAREGAAAMIRGQYERAIELYDEALGTPDVSKFVQAGIYSDRGVAKWRLKQTKDAVDDFNQSIQLAPENANVYNNRGNALMDLGHPEEAIKDYDRAIALEPSYGTAFINRGNAYAALDKYDAAFQSYRKGAALSPRSAISYNGRGWAHGELERFHAAVRDLTRAIALDPQYAAAYRHRAEANFAIGAYAAAADDVTQSLELEPGRDELKLLWLRAQAYARLNRFREAIADFDKVFKLNPELADAYVERGVLFAKNKRYKDAFADYERAIERDPKNGAAYARRAEAKFKTKPGDEAVVSEALADVNQALLYSLNDPLALRIRANIYEAQERASDAVYDYQKALEKDPFQAESREALARLGEALPANVGQPLGPAVDGWTITEVSPGRYVASNPEFKLLRAELEMFGEGKPKILGWSTKQGSLAGIGLLKYYAGNNGIDGDLEYVAVLDTRANKMLSVEPEKWGGKPATWTWQTVSVIVTDPDGQANELNLRGAPAPRPAVRTTTRRRSFWGSNQRSSSSRKRTRRPRGGSPLDWLFR